MNVVFAAGGTGGHIYPAIAIAAELKKKYGATITFVGTADRLETTIVPQAGYKLETISAKPFSKSLGFVLANIQGIFQSFGLLQKLKPDLVIATGGYVCFPFVLAARLSFLRIPIALLEPNVQSGLTNRLLKPLVSEIWHETPVRASLANVRSIPKIDARQRLGLNPNKNVLLVMGGSQGANSINNAVVESIEKKLLPENWQVLLISGKTQTPIPSIPNLQVVEYLNDMSDAYASATYVLARAGASTLAELQTVGLPAILVPYPYATDNHQKLNAQTFAKTNQAVIIKDKNLTPELLAKTLTESLTGESGLRNVGPTTGAMDGGREEAAERDSDQDGSMPQCAGCATTAARSPEGGANSVSATPTHPSGFPAENPTARIVARIQALLSRKHT